MNTFTLILGFCLTIFKLGYSQGDCNYAMWLIYPFVDGECNFIEQASFGSYKATCASNGNSATLTQYSSYDCSGTAINETDADVFYCDASGDDCDPIVM